MSSSVAVGVAKGQFFRRLVDRLNHNKAVVRLNLLRILRAVCDVHPDRAGLVERYGLYGIVERLSKRDGAVLVRELAREMIPSLAIGLENGNSTGSFGMNLKGGGFEPAGGATTPKAGVTPRKRVVRRSASEAFTPLSNGVSSAPHSRPRLKPLRQKLTDIPWQPINGRPLNT